MSATTSEFFGTMSKIWEKIDKCISEDRQLDQEIHALQQEKDILDEEEKDQIGIEEGTGPRSDLYHKLRCLKEHSCKFCGKQFSFKCTKVKHERNSCGKNIQTLYSCEMCEKVFSRSDSRVRHMIKAHGMAPLNSVTRKTKQPEIQEQ